MLGSDRKRFCGECKLNVYNLSGMTKAEAENLLLNSEGRLCVRFYKRADGSVLTKDCPVGWQAIKRRVSRMAAAAFALLIGLLGGLGLASAFALKTRGDVVMGNMSVPTPTPKPKISPEVLMGAIAMPTPTATPKPKSEVLMGKVAVSKN